MAASTASGQVIGVKRVGGNRPRIVAMTHGLSRPCSAIISCACSTLTRGVRFGSSGSAVIVMVSHDSPAFVHDSYSRPVVLVGLAAWRFRGSCGLPVKVFCAALPPRQAG